HAVGNSSRKGSVWKSHRAHKSIHKRIRSCGSCPRGRMIAALRPNSGLCVLHDPTSDPSTAQPPQCDGVAVGRIMKAAAASVGMSWMWTLAFGQHEDRCPTHGYDPTREAATPRLGGWLRTHPLYRMC